MVGIAAATGAAITAAVVVSPALYFAYDRPELHLVLETTEALIAMLVVYLLIGRVRESGHLSDTLLVYALAVLGGTNLVATIPGALTGQSGSALETWGPLWTRVLGAVVFAAAAFVPSTRRVSSRGLAARVVGAAAATVLVGVAVGAAMAPLLPDLAAAVSPPEDLLRPYLTGPPLVHVTQVVSAALFAVAAIGFVRRAERHADVLMAWIAVSATVNAFARMNYFLFPSLYSEYVYSGDILRLASYLLLLIGASGEIRTYWQRVADSAVTEERRKIARDLHDGLAQELNFVSTQVRRLTKRPEMAAADLPLQRIASASQRALDESRRAIDYLQAPADEELRTLLPRAAEQVAGRVGARVRCVIDSEAEASPEVAEQLVRIVREAVTNATRHGGADYIELTVAAGPELVLVVEDNGSGFDHSGNGDPRSGFGLVSMRERAEALGGVFDLRSRPGEGTTVEVRVPSTT